MKHPEISQIRIGLEKLIISKSLKADYANPTTIPHKMLADRMGITIEELNKIRRRTIDNAKKVISTRKSSNGNGSKEIATFSEQVKSAY